MTPMCTALTIWFMVVFHLLCCCLLTQKAIVTYIKLMHVVHTVSKLYKAKNGSLCCKLLRECFCQVNKGDLWTNQWDRTNSCVTCQVALPSNTQEPNYVLSLKSQSRSVYVRQCLWVSVYGQCMRVHVCVSVYTRQCMRVNVCVSMYVLQCMRVIVCAYVYACQCMRVCVCAYVC